jgi:hypothetical protein
MVEPFIGDKQGLNPLRKAQLNTYAATLFSILAKSHRFELLGQLVETVSAMKIGILPDIVSACQAVLPYAATRFQHILIRYLPLRNAFRLNNHRGWNNATVQTELIACADICRISKLAGLHGMVLGLRCKMENILDMVQPRMALEHVGHYRAVLELDVTKLQLALNGVGALMKVQVRRAAREIILQMFQRDSLLIGSGPVHGINTVLFTYLMDTMGSMATRDKPDFSIAIYLTTVALEAYKASLARGRGPQLIHGRQILRHAVDLLDKVYLDIFNGIYTHSRDLARLRHEASCMFYQDFFRTAVDHQELLELSAASTAYAEKAVIWARWCDRSSDMEDKLEQLEEFLNNEIPKDIERGQSYDAVTKCGLLTIISLYHPRRAHIKAIEYSGESYNLALSLLDQNHIWADNESRINAISNIYLCRGAWLAWTGAGRGHIPRFSDYWTYNWLTLGTSPNNGVDPNIRAALIRESRYSNAATLRGHLKLVPMLRNCVRENTGMFDRL